MDDAAERSIKVASLSELSSTSSKRLGYAPFILKTDISQYFPSIYTHSISWSRHGIIKAKSDTSFKSNEVYFNQLDFYIRNCQSAQTRGLIVGPDAFRLVAEFIAAGIDSELRGSADKLIIGAVRHVDDYYIGIRSESDGLVVLSILRDILARYELQLNDTKTRIYNSLEPINDIWAQQTRKSIRDLSSYIILLEDIELLFDSAFDVSRKMGTDSPIKMVLRGLDNIDIYDTEHWEFCESYFQRLMYYHPHAIDYVCLLVVKRNATDGKVDFEGWKNAAEYLIERHIQLNNHHEIVWLLWMMLCCEIDITERLLSALERVSNAHVQALLVQAFLDGRIHHRPKIRFSKKLPSTDDKWLLSLVARSGAFTKASFGGDMAAEFEHLANRRVRLVDIGGYVSFLARSTSKAISRTRYGYDDENDDDEDEF